MTAATPRTVEQYLDALRAALRGADPALVQDALYDAEEHLHAELAQHPGQAEGEVLSQELDIARLRAALKRMRKLRLQFVELAAPSPFSLPLMVERFREQFTTEKLADRVARMLADAEAALQREDAGRQRTSARRNGRSHQRQLRRR